MPLHSNLLNLGYSTPYSVFNTISREEKLKRILKDNEVDDDDEDDDDEM